MATGALAAAGTGMLMLTERLDSVEQASQSTGSATLAAIDSIRAERSGLLQPIEGRIGEVEKAALEAAQGARTETSTEVAALHARLATAEARSTELRSALDATRRELEQARAEAREALSGRDNEIASLQKVIQFHGDSLVELRERIREAGALVAAGQVPGGVSAFGGGAQGLGPAGANQPGAGGAAGPAAAAARWAALLPDLKNPDEAQRLTAVIDLGETGDPAVAPHIVPMLKDTDSFVRMVSVQALGDLKYKPAVPHLIEALSDDRWTVREAARDSLRTVTGKNFGFDPTGRDLDMKKKIDQWRSWWRREGDNFLTQA
ncbi:MAG: HEAT repeat domain-containing protein [Planctomycetota bacterium]